MSSILGERADDSDTGSLMTTLLTLDYLHRSYMARSQSRIGQSTYRSHDIWIVSK
jgi:hypothetical protein